MRGQQNIKKMWEHVRNFVIGTVNRMLMVDCGLLLNMLKALLR